MIGQRIREFRKRKGFKIVPFSKLIGISAGSLSDIETGKTKPSADTIESNCRLTDIDPKWLIVGYAPREESWQAAEAFKRFLTTRDKIEEIVNTLSEKDQRIVLEFATFLKKKKEGIA